VAPALAVWMNLLRENRTVAIFSSLEVSQKTIPTIYSIKTSSQDRILCFQRYLRFQEFEDSFSSIIPVSVVRVKLDCDNFLRDYGIKTG